MTLAAQDLCHLVQGEEEKIVDFICWLKHQYKLASGWKNTSKEKRNVMLLDQLQDGLKQELIMVPSVLGAHNFSEFCVASWNKEKRLIELK